MANRDLNENLFYVLLPFATYESASIVLTLIEQLGFGGRISRPGPPISEVTEEKS